MVSRGELVDETKDSLTIDGWEYLCTVRVRYTGSAYNVYVWLEPEKSVFSDHPGKGQRAHPKRADSEDDIEDTAQDIIDNLVENARNWHEAENLSLDMDITVK